MSHPQEAKAQGSPSTTTLAEAYARRPVRPSRGLVPGRRVWVTLGAAGSVAAVIGLVAAVTQDGAGAVGPSTVAAPADPVFRYEVPTDPAYGQSRPTASGDPSTPATDPAPVAPVAPETPAAPAPPAAAPPAQPPPAAPVQAAPPPANPPKTVTTPPPAPKPTPAPQQPAPPPPAPQQPAPPPPQPDFPGVPLVNPASNKCLSGSAGSDGTHVILWGCNGNVNQKWDILGNGTIQIKGVLCMDAAWGGTANGTLVQIAYCSGNPAQQFTLRGNALYSKTANKCVEVRGRATNDGAEMVLWDCNNNPAQQWVRR